jgi:hypothetical protein
MVVCESCGQRVNLDRDGKYVKHTRGSGESWEDYDRSECPGGGLYPTNQPPQSVYGMPTHFESDRRKH